MGFSLVNQAFFGTPMTMESDRPSSVLGFSFCSCARNTSDASWHGQRRFRLGRWLPHKTSWLVLWTPLKNISQLGWLFPIYGKIKNVPNHQPASQAAVGNSQFGDVGSAMNFWMLLVGNIWCWNERIWTYLFRIKQWHWINCGKPIKKPPAIYI